ncbi:F-box family protein [Quillaja saponaria]|uniref:F-box family protein n=1 Tax=Quillaja saponaria TaxID=32244 RepID=A0AAD7Q6V6_QUISA|nr:F-box family protein [Quillaja saponaria]
MRLCWKPSCRNDPKPKEMMIYIPKDILYDIFLLLPVPTLVLFKSLNKTWHAKISSRAFAREHLHRWVNERSSKQQKLFLLDLG